MKNSNIFEYNFCASNFVLATDPPVPWQRLPHEADKKSAVVQFRLRTMGLRLHRHPKPRLSRNFRINQGKSPDPQVNFGENWLLNSKIKLTRTIMQFSGQAQSDLWVSNMDTDLKRHMERARQREAKVSGAPPADSSTRASEEVPKSEAPAPPSPPEVTSKGQWGRHVQCLVVWRQDPNESKSNQTKF